MKSRTQAIITIGLLTLAVFWDIRSSAQWTGQFYGKVINAESGKPIEFSTIKVYQEIFDSSTSSNQTELLGGALSQANGDFLVEDIPYASSYQIEITSMGYHKVSKQAAFSSYYESMLDLGNIELKLKTTELGTVVIDGSAPAFSLEIDKKVFNVSKNPVTDGGSAIDVLRNVPSLNVGMEGGVSLRGGSPQILIDGRPSLLTLDQIPADAIESVEVMTNPSAKYDASGGAGIVNIILKKNRRMGFNGSVSGWVNSLGAPGGRAAVNIREKKLNFFLSGYGTGFKSNNSYDTERIDLTTAPNVVTNQHTEGINKGGGFSVAGGMDYFINNRNTLTLRTSLFKFHIDYDNILNATTDSSGGVTEPLRYYDRNSDRSMGYYSWLSSVLYKKLFVKKGRELTADISHMKNENYISANYSSLFYDIDGNSIGGWRTDDQNSLGATGLTTAQTDFVNPIGENAKIEFGARGIMMTYDSNNEDILYIGPGESNTNNLSYDIMELRYAGYVNFSSQIKKFGYQLGLRAEGFGYDGTINLNETKSDYVINYPISLFPSAFLSYDLNQRNDLQFSYSRRINRPGFTQLIPFEDLTDPLNIMTGNAALSPEFANKLELNYQHTFGKTKRNTVLLGLFYTDTKDRITSHQSSTNDIDNNTVFVTTYKNMSRESVYGSELTISTTHKYLDINSSITVYNSTLDGRNIEAGMYQSLWTATANLSTTFKLPFDIRIQISGNYQSENITTPSESGYNYWGGTRPASAQGVNGETFYMSASVNKRFGKQKNLSATISISDIFGSGYQRFAFNSTTHRQNTTYIGNTQLVRASLTYRFGRTDGSIFSRRNQKSSMMEGLGVQ